MRKTAELLVPKVRTKKLNTSLNNTKNMESENAESKGTYLRRTITISPRINQVITNLRIQMMQDNPAMEYDYTVIANALMAYGIVFFENYIRSEKDEKNVLEIVGNKWRLAEYGLGDAIENLRRLEDQELVESTSYGNSDKEEQRVGTPKA